MASASRAQLVQLQIPEQLESNINCKLDRAFLIRGHVVARYTNSGTLVVGNAMLKSLHSIPNPSPILAMTLCYPHVVTVHVSETVQVYNVESKQCDQYQQEKGLVEGVRCILANSRMLLGLAPKRIIVWDRDTMTSQPPRVVDLSSTPTQIASIGEFSTLVGDTRVLLINANPGGHAFQVWDHVSGELVAYAENPAKLESFLTFDASTDGLVVGTLRDVMYIWNTAGKPGLVQPAQTVKFDKTIVTAVEVDQQFIIAGDNFGGVTLHTRTGRLIYHLTRKRVSDVDVASAQLSQLSTLFRNKVNRILRIGRWVAIALDSSRVEIYDIFSPSLSTPIDAYIHPSATGGVRDITVGERNIYALFSHAPRDAKAGGKGKGRPDLLCWVPKTEADGFEFLVGNQDVMLASPIAVLQQWCTKASISVKKLESVGHTDEMREHTKALTTTISQLGAVAEVQQQQGLELPFNLLQNLASSLDAYDSYLAKLVKGGKVSTKAREYLEDLRQAFARSVDLLVNCADFLGDVKSRTGVVMPYSEKMPKLVTHQDELSVGGFGGAQGDKVRQHKKKQRQGKKPTDSEGEPPSTGPVGDEDDGIDDMLGEVIDELGYMHEQTSEMVDRYDAVCNEGIHDPDKIMPLLSIYTKLRQLAEDLKETAKEVGELRNDDPTGEWWEGGGEYDDVGAEPAPVSAAAPYPSSTPR